jgi:hypothetical protein
VAEVIDVAKGNGWKKIGLMENPAKTQGNQRFRGVFPLISVA